MEEKNPFFQYLVTGPKSCLIESSYVIDVGFIVINSINKSNLVKILVAFIKYVGYSITRLKDWKLHAII